MSGRLPRVERIAGTLLLLAGLSGCATAQAYRARFSGPDYTVTPEYYARSPHRVAVFPFASRSMKEKALERAQVCRIAFYQHFSVRDFEDVELEALDRRLLPPQEKQPNRRLRQFADTIHWLDVVGLTSVLDLEPLWKQRNRDTATFRAWTKTAYEGLQADAYVLGITRSYGRFYAVLFSSIGLATHVEMRSLADDALLWSVEYKARDVALPLTIDPLDLPVLLFDIWKNSYGESLDLLAFRVYREMVKTLPPARAQGTVHVQAAREKTRLFSHPTLWAFWPGPHVEKGTRMKFLLERRGWYQCEGPDGAPRWILRNHGTLVDGEGQPLEATDPLRSLWRQEP